MAARAAKRTKRSGLARCGQAMAMASGPVSTSTAYSLADNSGVFALFAMPIVSAPRLRVLLVGASGVIGRWVNQALAPDCEVITAGLDDPQHPVDLANSDSIHALLKAVHDTAGPLDAVISTAGRARFARLARK